MLQVPPGRMDGWLTSSGKKIHTFPGYPLDDAGLATPSPCSGWDVDTVAAPAGR